MISEGYSTKAAQILRSANGFIKILRNIRRKIKSPSLFLVNGLFIFAVYSIMRGIFDRKNGTVAVENHDNRVKKGVS